MRKTYLRVSTLSDSKRGGMWSALEIPAFDEDAWLEDVGVWATSDDAGRIRLHALSSRRRIGCMELGLGGAGLVV